MALYYIAYMMPLFLLLRAYTTIAAIITIITMAKMTKSTMNTVLLLSLLSPVESSTTIGKTTTKIYQETAYKLNSTVKCLVYCVGPVTFWICYNTCFITANGNIILIYILHKLSISPTLLVYVHMWHSECCQ